MTYSKSRNPIVAMPGTSEWFALYLCFTMNYDSNAKLVTIKIGEAKVEADVAMTCFFATLECAVKNIATNDYSGRFAVKPKPDLQLNKPLNSSSSVFQKGETVDKFYDLRRLNPHIEVMEMIENG